jgi:hypothetical protein
LGELRGIVIGNANDGSFNAFISGRATKITAPFSMGEK